MKKLLCSALLAGGLLFGGSAGVSALPATPANVLQSALAEVSLVQDVSTRCGRRGYKVVRWVCKPRPKCCAPCKPRKKPSKPKC